MGVGLEFSFSMYRLLAVFALVLWRHCSYKANGQSCRAVCFVAMCSTVLHSIALYCTVLYSSGCFPTAEVTSEAALPPLKPSSGECATVRGSE